MDATSSPRVDPDPEERRTAPGSRQSLARRLLVGTLRVVLPLAVLAAGGAAAVLLVQTAPKAKPSPPVRRATLVKIETIEFSPQQVVVEAMGTVRPARSVDLHPRVSGEIVELSSNLVPGGLFRKGQTMLRIDAADYELAVRQRASEVAKAEAELQTEMGNQSIAQKEYELLGEVVREEDRDLVLRKPQLETVRASLEAARAALEAAELDLGRTTIRAPFNAIVQSHEVNIGARVTENTTLATLVGTDTYWVEVSVPVDQLRWLRIPERHRNGDRR